ncbi:hypothetical protein ACROYT_G035049 [Oculina patagonica]
MATSVNTEDLAEHLKCAVCLERFEDPKVLRCQHLYCKKCLKGLVTRVGRQEFEITCPECRKKTEVPGGDVTGLPCNYVINKLLSKQSDPTPNCKDHDGEKFKFLCQDCDKLICRDCIAIEHRDHKCAFIKDIFPAEKEKIIKCVEESRVNILSLESSIETLNEQEDSLNKNFLKVNQELDSLIDKQIELLQMKRQNIKDELRMSVLIQKTDIRAQTMSFDLSRDRLKNIVSDTEKTLRKGSEVEVLLAKNQMIQKLTEINSATADLKPRGMVSYDLEADPPLDENTVGKIAKVREYDEEYKLTIIPNVRAACIGSLSYMRRTVRGQEQETLVSINMGPSIFNVCPKRKNTKSSPDNKVQVNIALPNSNSVHSPAINNGQDGSFSFSYNPGYTTGDYKIEIIINGRYLFGSPFTWKVSC